MGSLDEIRGQVLGALNSSNEGEKGAGTAVSQVFEAVQKQGLGNLLEQMRGQGLEEAVASWVGTGSNQPVSASQLQGALGPEMIEKLAAQLGLPPGQAAALLSKVLPYVIDLLTPRGKVEEGAVASEFDPKQFSAAESGETEV